MRFCILVTTRGRLEALERLFESLLRQTHQDFFLLLGDQSGSRKMDALLSRYADSFAIERHILTAMSLSVARNALLPFVMGEYVYFSDDDSYLSPTALANMARYAQQHPDAGALVGSGSPSLRQEDVRILPAQNLSRYSVFRNCPSWCIFIKKEILPRIGAFDEDLGIGAPTPWQSGEETDYLLRLLQADVAVIRCPSVHMYHDAEGLRQLNIEKIKRYGAGRMRIIQKHSLPEWFALCNILYPIFRAVLEAPRVGWPAIKRRQAMFNARLKEYTKSFFD